MSSVSYQTIKLSKGKHTSAHDGACVMELASMLAGERFSDHPESVSPVIGAFLRAYNDWVDDGRRQDLYGYAAKAVGSRTRDDVEQARADRLAAWAMQMRRRSWTRALLPKRLQAISHERRPSRDVLGAYAVRSISRPSDESHAAVLALIDELLDIKASDEARVSPPVPSESASRRYAGLTTFVDGDGLW
jgi:hypothetical protein